MKDFISLSCPSCGGKLEISNDVEKFYCMYCGNEHVVNRSGGVLTIKPILDGLEEVKNEIVRSTSKAEEVRSSVDSAAEKVELVQIGTDKTASELAIIRLTDELNKLQLELSGCYLMSNSEKFVYIVILIIVAIWYFSTPKDTDLSCCIGILAVLYFGYVIFRFLKSLGNKTRVAEIFQRLDVIEEQLTKHKEIVGK